MNSFSSPELFEIKTWKQASVRLKKQKHAYCKLKQKETTMLCFTFLISFILPKILYYDAIFEDYEQNKIIKSTLVRTQRETTKIRAVFDASCTTTGPFLNDCLHSGQNLLSDIFDILWEFRFNYIAILADIKQAFLNVEIADKYRDFLRFLWYDDVTSEKEAKVIIFRFLRSFTLMTLLPGHKLWMKGMYFYERAREIISAA
ncbi:uncharacterized protein LOC130613382 [Hydractinia symbiolongicarpus]|uniref:uncharacterized protein LOC130613382 n=1 Tax=Hydractinia symbiolongicarpus TaxID=13093 RepID=UPI00254E0FA3|nr:uncharacterized protein LOC130613382 [Hydractinia symbiolongicarpus]